MTVPWTEISTCSSMIPLFLAENEDSQQKQQKLFDDFITLCGINTHHYLHPHTKVLKAVTLHLACDYAQSPHDYNYFIINMLQKVMIVTCWHTLSCLVTTFLTGIFRWSLNHHHLSSIIVDLWIYSYAYSQLWAPLMVCLHLQDWCYYVMSYGPP